MNAQLFSLSAMQEGIWGGVEEDENGVRRLTTAPVRPGYVDCDQQGRLPGCLFEFDNPDDQCRDGRQGEYCWEGGRERGGREELSCTHN